jgi:1-deoxy-D-xylulose-5-phosphate synthase
MDEQELRHMMYTASLPEQGPVAIRYPRGRGVCPDWRVEMQALTPGKGRRLSEGKEIAILSLGHPGNFAAEAVAMLASEGISAAHYDLRYLKPLDSEILQEVCTRFKRVITVEDGAVAGGFGSAVIEWVQNQGYNVQVVRLGVPDRFIGQGSLKELYHECGFDAEGIARAAKDLLRR